MKRPVDFSRTRFVDPIWLTISVWLFVLVGAAVVDLEAMSPLFVSLVAVGIASHVAGMAVRRFLRLSPPSRKPRAESLAIGNYARRIQSRNNRATLILLTLLGTGIAFFVRAYGDVVPSLDGVGFIAARNAYLEEVRGVREKLFLYTTHLTLLGIAVLFYSARSYARARQAGLDPSKSLINAVALSAFCSALLTTGRTAPLLVILCYAFYCLRFRIFSKMKIVAAFAVASLGMFLVVAFALGKEGLGDGEASALDALANLGRVYFFSAPVAMQRVMLDNEVVSNACSNIFSYPIDLARKLGFFAHCDIRELDFVFIPVPTNVFTFLRAYWEDFGWGYPLALFGTGFLIEWAHRLAVVNDGYGAFIYPFVLNALLLQVFEEQLFANGSVLLYLTLAFALCAALYDTSTRHRRIRLRQRESEVLGVNEFLTRNAIPSGPSQ